MPASAYYDSCIFLNALNSTHREHESCLAITTPSRISWIVWICVELIAAETTAVELANAFEVNCALEGKIVVHANLSEGRSFGARYKNEKRRLKDLQLKDRDFWHLMCAVAAHAEVLSTVDSDFWDATNKRTPGAKKLLSGTRKLIEKTFPIRILLPSELLAA